ncbi:GNAT family N-acetyltransferase [Photobacterium sagamiensis]|uniref:GNAT family N-acetyltransferase n=1 Tax=Photobacterium sagamiensis TaxID=2910241 RepID=UPI003D132F5E
MEVIVRHSEDKDIEPINNLYAGKNALSGTLQLPFPSLSMWEKRLNNLPEGVYSLVAEKDGMIVGQLGFEAIQRARRKHVGSFGMAVHDDHQGLGVGTKLLTAAIDLAENWLNISRVELSVFVDNHSAIALYEKHGFVIEGEAVNFAYRNGQYVNVYHMARLKKG